MVDLERSIEREILDELLDEGGDPAISRTFLNATMLPDLLVAGGGDALYGRTLNKLLIEAGFTKIGRLRLAPGEEKTAIWSQEPHQFEERGKVSLAKIKAWFDPGL